MILIKKIPRVAGIFLACVLTVILVGLAVFYSYAQRDPDELVNKYLAEFSAQTGLQIRFEAIDITLLPLPTITLSNLVIENDELNLRIPWLSARPGFFKLLKGDFSPAYLNILRPSLQASLPLPLTELSQIRTYLNKQFSFLINPETDGDHLLSIDCDIDIYEGHIKIFGTNETQFIINNIETQLSLSLPDDISCTLDIYSINFSKSKENLFTLAHIKSESKFNPHAILADKAQIVLSFTGTAADIIKPTSFSFFMSSNGSKWNVNGAINGELDRGGVPVPLAIKGKAHGLAAARQFDFQDIEWQLDNDSGELDARLFLPTSPDGFQLIGRVTAHRLSLTQWFGFARNLCPGLQLSLDNIFKASLNFKLNSKNLEVPVIEAVCNGSRFTGTGGVSDFSRPVVFLRLKTAQTNLGLALPESLGKSPQAPVFPYPPLTPMPGEPLQPGETGIGYNINLLADKLVYGPLPIEKVALHIYPGKMDKIRLEDVLLDAKGSLYGGQIIGNCILGAAKELPINITGTAQAINAASLSKSLSILPVNSGKIDASLNVFSKGKKLETFLANLHGNIATRGKNIVFSGTKQLFSMFDIKSTIKTALLDKNRVIFDGKWITNAQNSDWNINSVLNGKIWLGDAGAGFQGLPVNLNLRSLKPSPFLKANTTLKINGQASFSNVSAELQNAKILLGDNTINGNFKFNIKNKSAQGNLSTYLANLPDFLNKAGFSSPDFPAPLRKLQFKSEFSLKEDMFKFSKLRAAFGNLVFTGDISLNNRQPKPLLEFSLVSEDVDANPFTNKNNAKTDKRPWNFRIMNDFNASGSLMIKKFSVMNLAVENIHMPMRLENGILSIGPNSGSFYGAAIKNRSLLDFNNGLTINSVLAINDFNLDSLVKDRKMESSLNGTASLEASINAHLTGAGQMPGRLNGNWNFSARDGLWQDKKGGKPTKFDRINASGNIGSGILKSNNFILKSPTMEVKGSGWLNLGNDKIECNFNVNMRGLPDFPLQLYGNLNNIKTSIGAGKMVLNAIGGITTGFVNIIGGVVKGIWKIFW